MSNIISEEAKESSIAISICVAQETDIRFENDQGEMSTPREVTICWTELKGQRCALFNIVPFLKKCVLIVFAIHVQYILNSQYDHREDINLEKKFSHYD